MVNARLEFNDSVAGVDRNRLDKARQISRTSLPRRGGEKSDALDQVNVFNILHKVLLGFIIMNFTAQIDSRTGYFVLTLGYLI